MTTKLIPVIIMSNGTNSKSYTNNNLINITGKHDITELQNRSLFDTEHVLREVLM